MAGFGPGLGAEGIAWGSLIAEYTAAAAALLWLTRLDSKLFETWQLQGIRTLLTANAWVMLRTLAFIRHDLDEHQECSIWRTTGGHHCGINAVIEYRRLCAGWVRRRSGNPGGSIHRPRPARNSETRAKKHGLVQWTQRASRQHRALFCLDAWVWLLVPQPEIANAIQPWLGYVIPLPLVAWISYWLDGVFWEPVHLSKWPRYVGIHWRIFPAAIAVGRYDRPLERLYPMATDPSRPDVLGLLEQAKNSIIS